MKHFRWAGSPTLWKVLNPKGAQSLPFVLAKPRAYVARYSFSSKVKQKAIAKMIFMLLLPWLKTPQGKQRLILLPTDVVLSTSGIRQSRTNNMPAQD